MTTGIGQEVTTVRPGHGFDEAVLADYLSRHVEGFAGPVTVRQFAGGQSNPTFLLDTSGARFVLRKKPPGKLLPSAHQIEREHRVMAALAETGVPVPPVVHLCEDETIIGTPFFVMRFVEGRVFEDPLLEACDPAERRPIYLALMDTLARLHKVDWQAVGLGDFGRTDAYVARQVARWTKQYEAAKTEEIAAMDKLIAWLPQHMPAKDETTLVHGDFRLGNLIMHPREPRVLAILDWELSTLGHPLGDLAYCLIGYHYPTDIKGVPGLGGRDLDALNIPSEMEMLAEYCRLTGRDGVPDHRFFVVFSLFRIASIFQGIRFRAQQGNASSERAQAVGAMTPLLAELGWRLAQES